MQNKTRKLLTLSIVHDHPRLLLGKKKRGFGEGRWNGFGGKVEEGETVEQAAVREFREETGTTPHELTHRGILEFDFKNEEEGLEVHVFKALGIVGDPAESEEMIPKWFYIDEIPFKDMWPDDAFWFPLFLKDKKFRGWFHFDGMDKIVDMKLEEASEL